MTINIEHVNLWLEDLRTTDAPQVPGKLAKHVDEDPENPVGYCCLGRGCVVADIPMNRHVVPAEDDEGDVNPDIIADVEFYFNDCEELPPLEFHHWLGRESGENNDGVPLDWPTYKDDSFLDREGRMYWWSAEELNDSLKLTFKQIADVVAYIGIKP